MSAVSVAVAHRRTMVAEGIAAALARYPTIVPVAVFRTAEEAIGAADHLDAVAIDEGMPGAPDAAGRLRRRGVRVVMMGEGRGGANGNGNGGGEGNGDGNRVSMDAPVDALAGALAPRAMRRPSATAGLTKRQRQILALVARGYAGKQVARQLGISPKTVEQHKTRIFAKLGVQNQTAAVGRVMADRLEGGEEWIQFPT